MSQRSITPLFSVSYSCRGDYAYIVYRHAHIDLINLLVIRVVSHHKWLRLPRVADALVTICVGYR